MISSEELLDTVTIDDIIDILVSMGSREPKKDSNGNLYFTTICHGGDSQKLHCFVDNKFFACYTCCGTMSFYDVLMAINQWNFKQAIVFLADYKGIKLYERKIGLQHKKFEVANEIKFLDRHSQLSTNNQKIITLPEYDTKVLNVFDDYYPDTWEEEGIKEEVMKAFNIKFYFNQYKAIIPHYDINDRLVGIRGRNFLRREVDTGKKYMPVTIQGLTYKYPVQFNLYGLYQNQEAVRREKSAIIFESEKSVLKLGSYYGQENNIAVSVQGMNVSMYQRDLLLSQGVEDITIALDKQYQVEYLKDEYRNSDEYKEYVMYCKKLMKIVSLFLNYCNTYLILCWDNRIKYKDAPIDRGKETFEELYKERYLVEDINQIKELME